MMEEKSRIQHVIACAAVVSGMYVGLQLLSNVASLKIGLVAGYAVDLGAFCFPLTFTVRDIAHKLLGKRGVTLLVLAAAGMCLFASLYFALCTMLPGAAGTSGLAFDRVFSPMWRLVAASLLAMVVSELADTQVYHALEARGMGRQWLRVLVSNAFSIPLDNLIFSVVAFAGVVSWDSVGEIFLLNILIKFAVSLVGVPLIYAVPQRPRLDA